VIEAVAGLLARRLVADLALGGFDDAGSRRNRSGRRRFRSGRLPRGLRLFAAGEQDLAAGGGIAFAGLFGPDTDGFLEFLL
jgi:hypothetical protein